MLQARIDTLRDKLSRAYIVEKNNHIVDAVVFGVCVRVRDLDMDEEETYQLVGPGDEDYDQNKILTTSPIGQGLLGKKCGEIAEIRVPRGVLRYEVLHLSFPE
jgi:transcription elongation factor GreA